MTDHAQVIDCENKTKKCTRKNVNLLHFNRYKPPTCFVIFVAISGRYFYEGYITKTTKQCTNIKY